ncbi:helix-turn-helix domain-containing protein [Microbispora sp. NPDC049125]|uniref:helix-turn-helix domain-containing protein n=1 Tax=Microbispora sp. NPDC049125 TaxID=3154929 RepID=UPI0034656712
MNEVSKPIDEQLDADIVCMYGDGMSIRAIATAVSRSYGGVRATLTRKHVKLRSRGRGGARKASPAAVEAAAQ